MQSTAINHQVTNYLKVGGNHTLLPGCGGQASRRLGMPVNRRREASVYIGSPFLFLEEVRHVHASSVSTFYVTYSNIIRLLLELCYMSFIVLYVALLLLYSRHPLYTFFYL